MSAISAAVTRMSLVGRLVGARVSPLSLAPIAVAVLLFKLAISDGGRHAPALALAQVVTYVTVIVLLLTGVVRRSAPAGGWVAIVAVAAATTAWSVKPEASIRAVLQWLMYGGLVVTVGSSLPSVRSARWFADAIVASAGWLCLIALFVFWGANNPSMRWYSTFYWPNPFAAFLLLTLPIEIFRTLRAPASREALVHGAMSTLLGVALVLTYSRGAWLSLLAAGLVGLVVLRPPSWARVATRAFLLGVLGMVLVAGLTRGLGSAPADAEARAASIQGRLHFWQSAWRIFLDHPFGTGAGTFGSVHAKYQQDARFYASDAHNLYLQTAAEMGVPGVLALAVLVVGLGTMWRRVLRQARNADAYTLVAGTGIALLAFGVHSGVEMNWAFPANPAVACALAGMLVAMERVTGSPTEAPSISRRWKACGTAILALATAVTVLWSAAGREFAVGQRLARAGDWQGAEAAYARASSLDPLEPRYLGAEAAALIQLIPPRTGDAERALRRAMRLDRASASHPLQLAWVLTTQPKSPSRASDIEVLLLQAIALDPLNRPEAFRLLGRLYLERGEVERAERTYREAAARYRHRGLSTGMLYLLLWPEVAGLNMDWAALLMSQGRTAEAIVVLQDTLRDDPQWGPAYVWMARAYLQVGRAQDAGRTLQEGMDQRPDDVTLWIRWQSLQPRRPPVWAQ